MDDVKVRAELRNIEERLNALIKNIDGPPSILGEHNTLDGEGLEKRFAYLEQVVRQSGRDTHAFVRESTALSQENFDESLAMTLIFVLLLFLTIFVLVQSRLNSFFRRLPTHVVNARWFHAPGSLPAAPPSPTASAVVTSASAGKAVRK